MLTLVLITEMVSRSSSHSNNEAYEATEPQARNPQCRWDFCSVLDIIFMPICTCTIATLPSSTITTVLECTSIDNSVYLGWCITHSMDLSQAPVLLVQESQSKHL